MKKIFGLLMLAMAAVVLVACSHDDASPFSQSSSMDGTYYNFRYHEGSDQWIVSKVEAVKISGDTFEWNKDGWVQYSINKKEKTVTGDDETLAYSYDWKTKVLTFNDKKYVKKGSKKYNKLIDDGARVIER